MGYHDRTGPLLPYGWMSPYSAYMVASIGAEQQRMGVFGSVGEIGVFQGLFFIALANAAVQGERLFGCDFWDEILWNSGEVKYKRFAKNLAKYGVNRSHVRLLEAPS